MINRQITHLLLVFLSTVVLAACNIAVPVALKATETPPTCPPLESGEIEFNYETVRMDDGGGWQKDQEPQILLFNSAQELDLTKFAELESIDFDTYFVVILFRGYRDSTGYDAVIRRVTQRPDGVVTVCAELWSPNTSGDLTVETSPMATNYSHIIKVERENTETLISESVLQILSLTPTPIPY